MAARFNSIKKICAGLMSTTCKVRGCATSSENAVHPPEPMQKTFDASPILRSAANSMLASSRTWAKMIFGSPRPLLPSAPAAHAFAVSSALITARPAECEGARPVNADHNDAHHQRQIADDESRRITDCITAFDDADGIHQGEQRNLKPRERAPA